MYVKNFILGGARSGKSRFAEKLASESKKNIIYIATAQALDQEMHERIQKHKSTRPKNWLTIEEPINIANILNTHKNKFFIIDCLTLWLTNTIELNEKDFYTQKTNLLLALKNTQNDLAIVSNEIGLGVVPIDSLTRKFCDEIGFLHQEIAKTANRVFLLVAGINILIKNG